MRRRLVHLRPPAPIQCVPYGCSGDVCGTSCAASADCAAGFYCEAPACIPKKANSADCNAGVECTTGFCADGVCCDQDCGRYICSACTAAKKGSGADGTCGPVAAGTDPNRHCPFWACAGDVCDGAGNCVPAPAGTECAPASCTQFEYVPASRCDGIQACGSSLPQQCNGFACSSAAGCKTSCVTTEDCETYNYYCAAPTCLPKSWNGPCTVDDQCYESCVAGRCTCTMWFCP